MSAAAIEGIERRTIRPRRLSVKPERKSFVRTESRSVRAKRIAKTSLFWTFIASTVLIVAGAVASIFFYNHYSAIVERRVNAGFWQTRAGMYAAPYQLKKNQQATPDTVIGLLRRAVYIEGNAEANVWSGSFERTGNNFKITTSNAYSLEPETTVIGFSGGRIDEIRGDGIAQDTYQNEAEMLSGRS